MQETGSNLDGAVHGVIADMYNCIRDFDSNSASIQKTPAAMQNPDIIDQLQKLIEAYQAVATTVLNFSVQSPRYGLLKDRQEDGSFVVDL